MSIFETIGAGFGNFIGALMNNKNKAPKINVYSAWKKPEKQKRYFTFFYSKTYHQTYFFARLNVENLSETAGCIDSITLTSYQKNKFTRVFYPIIKGEVSEDPILFDYFNSARFKQDVMFESDLTLGGFEKKTVCFVFCVEDRASTFGADFDFSYSCSGKKHTDKNFKIKIEENIYDDPYTIKERADDKIAYHKEKEARLAAERAKRLNKK